MIKKIKTAIQNRLYQKSYANYEDTLRKQSNPYQMWIQETEITNETEGADETHPSISVIYQEDCTEQFSLDTIDGEIIVFVSKNGELSQNALHHICEYFSKHIDENLLYADEDIIVDGKRCCPWVKPIWSPETFFSFFYFGHIYAVRRKCLQKIKWLESKDYHKNIYDSMLQITENTSSVGHIEQVLFHTFSEEKDVDKLSKNVMVTVDLIGADESYDDIKIAALKRRGIEAYFKKDMKTGFTYPIYQVSPEDKVSIVIPSKDNQEVLLHCIRSVQTISSFKQYEIIVVDNGSNEQNRKNIDEYAKQYGFRYIYEAMEFNFSKMCNLGVSQATGNYILLLNDDMEVIQQDWLERMIGAASQAGVGAVGAKLLYPDSTLIQHVGITNTVDGPGHKLKQMDDELPYYFGRNHLIYNMIGVTAACLMVKKDTYLAIDGLFEELKVAYNDVDFNFRLLKHGLRNVQRNDVVLYHHESLSRGDDMQDERKMLRLKAEKETLYRRHPDLYMVDPYCGRNMNAGTPAYECRYVYGFEYADETGYRDYVEPGKKLPDESKMNHAIMVVTEECQKETLRTAGSQKRPYYLLKGWAYIPGADNSRYQMYLTLRDQNNGKVWQIPILKRYRKDVENILPGEVNVALTGFVCWIYEGSIPTGQYEVWMVAKDQCSRQCLYRNTEKILKIE